MRVRLPGRLRVGERRAHAALAGEVVELLGPDVADERAQRARVADVAPHRRSAARGGRRARSAASRSRTAACTVQPSASSRRTRYQPSWPVAPVTTAVRGCTGRMRRSVGAVPFRPVSVSSSSPARASASTSSRRSGARARRPLAADLNELSPALYARRAARAGAAGRRPRVHRGARRARRGARRRPDRPAGRPRPSRARGAPATRSGRSCCCRGRETISLCEDKYEAARFFERHGAADAAAPGSRTRCRTTSRSRCS